MTEDNLTRAEAADRAAKVSGLSYEVALDLTTGDRTFTSDTSIRFSAPLVGLATFVDLDAESVREITFNGRPFPTTAWDPDRARVAVRGLLANNELRIVADCAYQHTGVGLHRIVDPVDGKVYLHTQFEPFDAHRVFACFDQPDLKGSFALTVTAPDDWTVVSNSPAVASEVRDGGDGPRSTVWRFAPTPVISTYLAAVVAGPYHVHRERHGELELGLYCRESLAPHVDPEEILTITRQGLDFFVAEFDYPYPFDKYDQLFVPEFNFGAMENPGCITFNEHYLFRSRVTQAARESRANTILHEMAHMWFGDLVTMRWWDDLWLNESFATYMATHASAEATRFRRAWVRFAADMKTSAVNQDQLPSTHPITADIVDTDSVRLHFDGITYSKGASVLRQLVAWVGQDAFRTGLQAYFPEHEWDNATLTDFLSALEETSGRDLGAWSKEWLETAGVNTLRPAFELDAAGAYSSFAVLQEASVEQPTLRSHRVALGLYALADGELVRTERVELDVVGSRTEVPELAGRAQPELLVVNDEDLTYAKVRLDKRSLATLQDHLSRIREPLARTLCWTATWDMVRDAELPTRRFVALVRAHAAGEEDDSVLGRLLGQAARAVDVFGDPASRASTRAALATGAWEELSGAEPGSDRQLVWARHWLGTIDEPSDLSRARAILDGTEEIPGLAVDTEFRWSVVGTLAAHGADDGGALIEAELERDPTDIGQRRAATSRAARPVAEAKGDAWSAVHAGDLNLAMARAVLSGFASAGQEALVRPYRDPYFARLRDLWDERPREEALSLIGGLYPHVLVEPETVAATDRALADPELPGPVRRILLEGKDAVERALRARAADRPG
ncbi:MAG TPA: aminopeptidase N [Acidimicrobiales bacterium]|nr:aminopeptidase N [Acidimicrobiales bacterium]